MMKNSVKQNLCGPEQNWHGANWFTECTQMLTGRSFGKLKHFAQLWTEQFRPTCAAWADVPLQVADAEGCDSRLCAFPRSAPRWEGGWQGAEVLLVRTNGWECQKEQESKRGKGSEGSPGYMGSRVCVCVCHMFENRIHVAQTAAFYLFKLALITLANPLMSFHIKQTWSKQDKY